jgi:hypothetical protein
MSVCSSYVKVIYYVPVREALPGRRMFPFYLIQEGNMRVSINFSTLSDLGGKKEIIESLQQNALQAWENKPENTKLVRILQEIPAKSGRHFRFYSVVLHQRDSDCLIVR